MNSEKIQKIGSTIGMIVVILIIVAAAFTYAAHQSVDGYNGTNNADKLDMMITATTVTFNGNPVTALQGKTFVELKALAPTNKEL